MIVPPQLIRDAADWDGSYGSSNPHSVDTLGFTHCTIKVFTGSIDAAMTALRVLSGAAAASGADDSSYAEVTGAVASGSTGSGRLPQADDDEEYFFFDIDLRNDDIGRYLVLDATAGNGATGTYLFAEAVLSGAEEAPSNATERGAAWALTA